MFGQKRSVCLKFTVITIVQVLIKHRELITKFEFSPMFFDMKFTKLIDSAEILRLKGKGLFLRRQRFLRFLF